MKWVVITSLTNSEGRRVCLVPARIGRFLHCAEPSPSCMGMGSIACQWREKSGGALSTALPLPELANISCTLWGSCRGSNLSKRSACFPFLCNVWHKTAWGQVFLYLTYWLQETAVFWGLSPTSLKWRGERRWWRSLGSPRSWPDETSALNDAWEISVCEAQKINCATESVFVVRQGPRSRSPW